MSQPNDLQLEVLKEILKWVKFSGVKQLKEIVQTTLDTELKQKIYQLSDGITPSTKIAELTGMKFQKVSELWKEWALIGLGESLPARGGTRFKRSFDLRMFGISVSGIDDKKDSDTEDKSIISEDAKNGDDDSAAAQ